MERRREKEKQKRRVMHSLMDGRPNRTCRCKNKREPGSTWVIVSNPFLIDKLRGRRTGKQAGRQRVSQHRNGLDSFFSLLHIEAHCCICLILFWDAASTFCTSLTIILCSVPSSLPCSCCCFPFSPLFNCLFFLEPCPGVLSCED